MTEETPRIPDNRRPDDTVIVGKEYNAHKHSGNADAPPSTRDNGESGPDELLLDDLRVVFDRRTQAGDSPLCGPEELVGRHVGRYLVKKLLGEGGMARVYLAVDDQTGSNVALKTLKTQYQTDDNMSSRFEREARSMGRIQHEHVVRILDFPAHGPSRAIIMEYMSGGSLRNRMIAANITKQPMPIYQAVALIHQAAQGCAAAHAQGIVHRDIKPSNLLLDDNGLLKVADFGTLLVVEGATWLTGVGQQIGTPGYMSPEQCRGERASPSSDVYSLGVSLYELLTGHLPFEIEEASPFALMLKHISEPVPDPRGLRPDIPKELSNVILRCLAKHPDDRYQTATELVKALDDYPNAVQPGDDIDVGREKEHGLRVNVAAVKKQLQVLPQRAIVCWACRCARRVQHLRSPDPQVERALLMAEAAYREDDEAGSPHSASRALSRIRTLRAASLRAAYVEGADRSSVAAVEATRAAAAAAASAAGLCVADTAADAAFAARSAIAALKLAGQPVRPFWEAALSDYHKLVNAGLGREGTLGHPVPPHLFNP